MKLDSETARQPRPHGAATAASASGTAFRRDATSAADADLVARTLRGDTAAVDELLGRLSCVVRFVFRLNKTMGYRLPVEALEDAVQQVYLALWPRLQRYKPDVGSIESWVFGFCRNCLRAEARRRQGGATGQQMRVVSGRSGDADALATTSVASSGAGAEASLGLHPNDENARTVEGAVAPSPGPQRLSEQREGMDALRDELNRLDAGERTVVRLRHLEDWSFERIAEHLGAPVSTVKDRCYRALIKLKGRLRSRDVSA